MKIAFIALPQQEKSNVRVAPPLPLCYMAALLEQQRHIIRIYDLALEQNVPIAEALLPLRIFRPQMVVIAADDPLQVAAVEAALDGWDIQVVRLATSLREFRSEQAIDQMLPSIEQESEKNIISDALLALDNLDALPFPARHLLSLEQYPLSTATGELKTTVILARRSGSSSILLRHPSLIIAELSNIVREHGIRHFIFLSPPITHNKEWLHDLLRGLIMAELGPCWEANVRHEALDQKTLELCRRAGCETLRFEFTAGEVLLSQEKRAELIVLIQQAHALGIHVRAHIELEAGYEAIPALVDISATFGLDDVQFSLLQEQFSDAECVQSETTNIDDVVEMVRSRYRSSRGRYVFVKRFGAQLGPLLWHMGRTGLLGRAWQIYASGEDNAMAY